MATYTWVGTTSGDFSVNTNFSPNGNPADGDTVIIDGAVSINAGLDQSSINLAALYIRETYTGQIGLSAGSPLKIAVSGTCDVRGVGPYFLNSGGSDPIVSLTVDMNHPQAIFDIGGTVTSALVLKGRIQTAAAFTNFAANNKDGPGACYVTWAGGSATTANQGCAGKTIAATTWTTMYHYGGQLFENRHGTPTTVHVIGKGTEFRHYNTGTVTLAESKDGAYFNATVDVRPKTITTFIRHPDSIAGFAPTVTVTNGIQTPARVTDYQYGDFSASQNTNPFFNG